MTIKNPDALLSELKTAEGYREHPYRDTTGHWTIGYGRNLTANGISKAEAETLLHNDITAVIADARVLFADKDTRELHERMNTPRTDSAFDTFPEAAQHVIVGMIFNLGVVGFRRFHHAIAHLQARRWGDAADEILNSLAARQLPQRYHQYAKRLRRLAEESTLS